MKYLDHLHTVCVMWVDSLQSLCICFTRLSSVKEGGAIASHDPADDSGSADPVANGKYFHLKNIEIALVSTIFASLHITLHMQHACYSLPTCDLLKPECY